MTPLRRLIKTMLSLGGIATLMIAGLGWVLFFGPTTEIAYEIHLAGTPATSVSSTVCSVEQQGEIVNGRGRGRREVRCDDRMTSTVQYADHSVICDLGHLSAVPFGGQVYAQFRIVGRHCEAAPDEAAIGQYKAEGDAD